MCLNCCIVDDLHKSFVKKRNMITLDHFNHCCSWSDSKCSVELAADPLSPTRPSLRVPPSLSPTISHTMSNSPSTPTVHGLSVTPLTQCAHWHSSLDIIAIQHFCCRKFYACISCHDACESHASGAWPLYQRSEKAVLCGQCKYMLRIEEYMASGSTCTNCGSGFNPGCKGHWAMYFEIEKDRKEETAS